MGKILSTCTAQVDNAGPRLAPQIQSAQTRSTAILQRGCVLIAKAVTRVTVIVHVRL